MIPKIIHYCWFGRNPKPESVLRYIQTWKDKMPDFEIKEWNEDNFDIERLAFTREAYEKGKYAFVSDVARIYALINEGGIYFDTDVAVIKRIDDRLMRQSSFVGFEDESLVGTAIIASEPNHPFWIKFFSYYGKHKFILEDNSLNMIPNVNILTKMLMENGLLCNNSYQTIENVTIYPKDYFSPKSYLTGKTKRTINTYTVHDFAGSWLPKAPWYVKMEKRIWNSLGFSNKNVIAKTLKLLHVINK